jgi:hypothetical protein
MKICYKCKKTKPLTCFSKDNSTKDKLVNKCKECAKSHSLDYFNKNRNARLVYSRNYSKEKKEDISAKKKKYYRNNTEVLKTKSRKFFQKNKKHYSRYQREKRHADNQYRLRCNFSSYLSRALKGKKMGVGWEKTLGYTLNDLISHLESLFRKGMSWENYGKHWDVDHKRPISWFSEKEFLDGWKLSNLQPLESSTNSAKRNWYEDK